MLVCLLVTFFLSFVFSVLISSATQLLNFAEKEKIPLEYCVIEVIKAKENGCKNDEEQL